ncbi:hypothetical protein BT93_K1265 [Corymbia citriodora subsp. variegata]|nr:hypothetical protein BT93_K1265 [Corymbia citriodora subsp. variegata]
MNLHDKLMAIDMNRTSTPRDETSLPGGCGDVLVPVVGADSGRIRLRQEVGPSEVSLMMTTTFRP